MLGNLDEHHINNIHKLFPKLDKQIIGNLFDLNQDEESIIDYLKESFYFFYEGVDNDIDLDFKIPSSKSKIDGMSVVKAKNYKHDVKHIINKNKEEIKVEGSDESLYELQRLSKSLSS